MLIKQRPEYGDSGKQLAETHNGGSVLYRLQGIPLAGSHPAACFIPAGSSSSSTALTSGAW